MGNIRLLSFIYVDKVFSLNSFCFGYVCANTPRLLDSVDHYLCGLHGLLGLP